MTTTQTQSSLSRAASIKHIPIGFILSGLMLSLWPAPAQNWTKIYTIGRLDKIACSGDGTKLIVCQHQFNTCVSSNSGVTWTELTMPNDHVWASAALSANGAVLTVTSLQGCGPCVHTSTNQGATWIAGDAPTDLNWVFISCSSDSSRMTVGGHTYTIHGNTPAPIYGSTNSGVHWTQIADSGVAYCSGDGTKLFQVDAGWIFKVSTSFGESWTATLTNGNGLAACSHDGETVYAGVNTNGTDVIYVSHDSGFNWSQTETPLGLYFYPRACSSDGTIGDQLFNPTTELSG